MNYLETLPTDLQKLLAPAFPWLIPVSRRWATRLLDDGWLALHKCHSTDVLARMMRKNTIRSLTVMISVPGWFNAYNGWMPAFYDLPRLAGQYAPLFDALLANTTITFNLLDLRHLQIAQIKQLTLDRFDLCRMDAEFVAAIDDCPETQRDPVRMPKAAFILGHLSTIVPQLTEETADVLALILEFRDTELLRRFAPPLVNNYEMSQLTYWAIHYLTWRPPVFAVWLAETMPSWRWPLFRDLLDIGEYSAARTIREVAGHTAQDWPRGEWTVLLADVPEGKRDWVAPPDSEEEL